MKAKILNILQKNYPVDKVSKDGRPYKMFTCLCNLQTAQGVLQAVELVAFSDKQASQINVGAEIEVVEQNFNGKITYKIEAQNQTQNFNNFKKPPGSYGKQAELTLNEYKMLCASLYEMAVILAEKKLEIAIVIFEKMLNNASFFVKQDSAKQSSNASNNVQSVQNTFNGQIVENSTDFVQSSIGESDVPW